MISARPDLNPIEITWTFFSKNACEVEFRKKRSTWENLEKKVIDVWNNINSEFVRNLESSYEKHEKQDEIFPKTFEVLDIIYYMR